MKWKAVIIDIKIYIKKEVSQRRLLRRKESKNLTGVEYRKINNEDIFGINISNISIKTTIFINFKHVFFFKIK